MHFSWPRFWVDHSKGFTYYLVRCAAAIEEKRSLMLCRHGRKEGISFYAQWKYLASAGGSSLWQGLDFSLMLTTYVWLSMSQKVIRISELRSLALDLLHQYRYTHAFCHLLGGQISNKISAWDEYCNPYWVDGGASRVRSVGRSVWPEKNVWSGAHCYDYGLPRPRNSSYRCQWIYVNHRSSHLLETGHGCRNRGRL